MFNYEYVTDRIFLLHGFLDAAECQAMIDLSESIGYTDAPITTALGPRMMQDVRNNTRVILDDPSRAESLYLRALPALPETVSQAPVVGLNERLRFYRYDPGQQFNWHLDGHFRRESGECSWLTFMVYLNDDFTGGATDFEDHHIAPRAGTALVFAHRQMHRGAPVETGRKYVLRTDVMYAPVEYEAINWREIRRQR